MVVGLDKFSAHFAGYRDRYVLIGGAAIWLVLDEAGIDPRATKDLDIVLCLEALDPEFGDAFWEFVKAAEYENKWKERGGQGLLSFLETGSTRLSLYAGVVLPKTRYACSR